MVTVLKARKILGSKYKELSDEMIYDLTDFIENMRVFHINGIIPAVAHIISIWQIHSGVTLDDGLYDVHYLDTMGNEHVTDIRCLKNLGS
jgi:hypothetical protein